MEDFEEDEEEDLVKEENEFTYLYNVTIVVYWIIIREIVHNCSVRVCIVP